MTIVRLKSGGLFLNSPIKPNEKLFEEINAIGAPQFAIGPNKYHHLYLEPWQKRFPKLQLFAGEGLRKKRTDIKFQGDLSSESACLWGADLLQIEVPSCELEEYIFYHGASKTLIVTDILMTLPVVGRAVPPRRIITDTVSFGSFAKRILSMDIERVVCAHGPVLEGAAAKKKLQSALSPYVRDYERWKENSELSVRNDQGTA